MKFKLKNIALVSLLAVAGIFGAGAAVFSKNVNETPIAEKADAAKNWASGDQMYLRIKKTCLPAGLLYIRFNTSDGWKNYMIGNVDTAIDIQGSDNTYYYFAHTFGGTPTSTMYIKRNDSMPTDDPTVWDTWAADRSHEDNLISIDGWPRSGGASYASKGLRNFYFKTPSNGTVTLACSDSGNNSKGNISTNTNVLVYSDWKVVYTPSASSGYQFQNWTYSSSASGTYIDWTSGGTANPATVYTTIDTYHSAKFQVQTYTVTFSPNGKTTRTFPSPATESVAYGGHVTEPTAPTAVGYSFGGWYKEAGCTNAWNFSSDTITGARTLFAKWTASSHTITKYAVVNGVQQAGNIGTETVDNYATYDIPSKIQRDNCTFDGWYTTSACNVLYTSKEITANTGIYAKYTNHGPWTGAVSVDLLNSGWADISAKYAIYFMDETTYSTEKYAWSSLTETISSGVRLANISYCIPFEPKKMTIVRFDVSAKEPSWEETWCNQTENIDVSSVVRIGDEKIGDKNKSYSGLPKIMGGLDPTWGEKGYLTSVKLNDSNNAEYYSTTVTLAQGEKFNILKAPYEVGDYATSWSTHSSLTSKFQDGGLGSIKAKEGGTYAVYFDSFANSIYITTVAISESDEWANYFMTNVGCDATGVREPTGWSSCATEYGKLGDAAKNIIYSASANPNGTIVQKAVARYDKAVSSHPGLSRFIVNSSSTPRAAYNSVFSPMSLFGSEDNFSTIIIIISSSVALLSVTALSILVIRKRKSKEIE